MVLGITQAHKRLSLFRFIPIFIGIKTRMPGTHNRYDRISLRTSERRRHIIIRWQTFKKNCITRE